MQAALVGGCCRAYRVGPGGAAAALLGLPSCRRRRLSVTGLCFLIGGFYWTTSCVLSLPPGLLCFCRGLSSLGEEARRAGAGAGRRALVEAPPGLASSWPSIVLWFWLTRPRLPLPAQAGH